MIIVKGRELLIPENERYIGTTYDDNSTVRTFRISRFHEDGMDKSQLDFYVIINYDDGSDPDAVGVVKSVSDDYIVLEWDVGEDVTEHSGCLYLWVRGFDYTGTVRWSSFPGVFYIEGSGTAPTDLSDLEQRISEEDKLIRLAKLYKSQPMVAPTAADMKDRENIYVYVGNEVGYQYGHWYFWNGSVWTPGGVYNSIAIQTDKELIAPDVAADAKVVGDHTSWYVTPKDYGAVGDGVADDTAAIQQAVSSGKAVVMTGTYKVTATVTLQSNTKILGFKKGTVIKTTTKFAVFSYYGSETIENINIDGLTLIGQKQWTGQSLSSIVNEYGIRIQSVERIKITNCTVIDFGGCGIDVTGNHVNISENTVKYTGTFSGELPNYNFGIAYNGEKNHICNNTVSGVIQGILSGLVNKETVISGNNISTNGQHGMYLEGADHVLVSNNVIHDVSLAGVKLQKQIDADYFGDINIIGNIIESCGVQGVLISDLSPNHTRIKNVCVSGNVITDTQRGMEIFYADDVMISNNEIVGKTDNTLHIGIRIADCDGADINGNLFKNIPADASYAPVILSGVVADKNIKIQNNTFIKTSGIKIQTANNGIAKNQIVSDNVFFDPISYDIQVLTQPSANEVEIYRNNCKIGLYLGNGITAVKRCYDNVGIAYREEFSFTVTDATRIEITSQSCYRIGDHAVIQMQVKNLVRGVMTIAATVDLPDVSNKGNVTINYIRSCDNASAASLDCMFAYDGSKLDFYVGGGTVNASYNVFLVI